MCIRDSRYGNFKPYVYKSTDGGMTWSAIQGNLPERGSVYTIAEDHVNKDLLFAGCLLYTSPSPRDRTRYRMPSSA